MRQLIAAIIAAFIALPSFALPFGEAGLSYGVLDKGLYVNVPLPFAKPRAVGIVLPTRTGGAALQYTRFYPGRDLYWSHSLYQTERETGVFYATALGMRSVTPINKRWAAAVSVETGLRTSPVNLFLNLRLGITPNRE